MGDIECPACVDGSWTCRVMGGTLDGAHESAYACETCAPNHFNRLCGLFDQVEIFPLGTNLSGHVGAKFTRLSDGSLDVGLVET